MNISEPTVLDSSFLWFPYGSRGLASSRLRVMAIDSELRKRGIKSRLGARDLRAGLWILQKRCDFAALIFAFRAVLLGKKLIFDIDDFFPKSHHDWWRRIKTIVSVSDLVTVSTEAQKELLATYLNLSGGELMHVQVLENCIDYGSLLEQPQRTPQRASQELCVCWFGNSATFDLTLPYIKAIERSCPNSRILTISCLSKEQKEKLPHARHVEWRYEGFSSDVKEADICLMSHFGDEISMAKSANKMIASIVLGVPVVASRTADYSRVATLCGLNDFTFSDEASCVGCVNRLTDPALRIQYLQKAQPILLTHYKSSAITDRFLSLAGDLEKRAITATRRQRLYKLTKLLLRVSVRRLGSKNANEAIHVI